MTDDDTPTEQTPEPAAGDEPSPDEPGHDPSNTPVEELLTSLDPDDDVFDQLDPDPGAARHGWQR